MKNERERLAALLAEGKISAQDFEALSEALDKRKGRTSSAMELALNPFQRIAGIRALGIGAICLVGMCAIAPSAHVHYPGLFDLQITKPQSAEWLSNFGVLIYQSLVNVFALGLIAFGSAFALRQKDLRIIDFIGTAALARLAYLPATIFFFGLSIFNKEALLDPRLHPAVSMLIAMIAIPPLVWLGVLYFNAYREASGLNGKKLWISYFVVVILGEAVSSPLTRMIFN